MLFGCLQWLSIIARDRSSVVSCIHDNLDHKFRSRKFCLTASACGCMAIGHPCIPNFIEAGEPTRIRQSLGRLQRVYLPAITQRYVRSRIGVSFKKSSSILRSAASAGLKLLFGFFTVYISTEGSFR